MHVKHEVLLNNMSQTTIPLKILQERWDELQEPYSMSVYCDKCDGLRIMDFIPYAYNTSSQKIIRVGRCHVCGKLIKIETKLESNNVE